MNISNSDITTDDLYLHKVTDVGYAVKFDGPDFTNLLPYGVDLLLVYGEGEVTKTTYSLAAAVASNSFMTKAGNLLYIGPALVAIAAAIGLKDGYKLVIVLTYPDGRKRAVVKARLHGRNY